MPGDGCRSCIQEDAINLWKTLTSRIPLEDEFQNTSKTLNLFDEAAQNEGSIEMPTTDPFGEVLRRHPSTREAAEETMLPAADVFAFHPAVRKVSMRVTSHTLVHSAHVSHI